MRGDPREAQIDKHIRKLKALGVNIRHEGHQKIVSIQKVTVDNTGIVLK